MLPSMKIWFFLQCFTNYRYPAYLIKDGCVENIVALCLVLDS